MGIKINTRDYESRVLFELLTSVKRYRALLKLYVNMKLQGYNIRFNQYGYIVFEKQLDNGMIDTIQYHKTMFK